MRSPPEPWRWPTAADKQQAQREGKRLSWSLWAERYEAFRLAGPGRSLLALYNAERERAGKPPAKRVPSSWTTTARDWDWRGRAAQWDAHLLAQRRKEAEAQQEKNRLEARRVRRMLLQSGYALLLEAMANTRQGIDDQKIARLMTAIHRHNEESRREYGDLPLPQSGVSIAVSAEDGKASAVISVIEVEKPADRDTDALDD
jgi:hypothetical protein